MTCVFNPRILKVLQKSVHWKQGLIKRRPVDLSLHCNAVKRSEELFSHTKSFPIFLVNSVNVGWYVLSKYYQPSDETPVYAAALLLYPRRRKSYILQNWPEDWHGSTIKAVEALWATYKGRELHAKSAASIDHGRQQRSFDEYDRIAMLLDVGIEDRDRDEFERFIHADPIKIDCTPLEW